ncbi:MAG: hypothetical protein RI995_1422 [Bacteroidota bacterium]
MAFVATYLNFQGKTEEAFNFYQSVFGGEFEGEGFGRFGEMAPDAADQIMHVELKITGGFSLMGSDAPASMCPPVIQGNNMHISLSPDTLEEAQRLFTELSAGENVTMALEKMFWGAYFGTFQDKFGIHWMINVIA